MTILRILPDTRERRTGTNFAGRQLMILDQFRLTGRVALVTGATRGLGQSMAKGLAEAGADIVSVSRSADDATVRELVARSGRRFWSFQVDLGQPDQRRGLIDRILAQTGRLDVLVNNAGISQNLPLALMEEEDWDRVMDVNVKGTFLTSRAVLRGMIRRKGGVIVNVGSMAGVRMIDAPVHYCASKAAVAGLTMALAKEVARHGIRVLCVAPGLLEDGVGRNLPDHRLRDYLKHCSLGRVGTLDEVARFAAFLASDRNGYMTGETIVMDGCV
jgi:NAD(P)-dependent dehydrogenase (short-subunit alcohol dehydrogenase family)